MEAATVGGGASGRVACCAWGAELRLLRRTLTLLLPGLCALVLVGARSADAATIVSMWDVPTITALEPWSDPANWDPTGVPNNGGGDDYVVTIRTLNPAQSSLTPEAILVDVPVTVTDLDIESATLHLEQDMNVTGQRGIVGHNRFVANNAIMSNVYVRHDPVVIAKDRLALVLRRAAAYRAKLTNGVAITNR